MPNLQIPWCNHNDLIFLAEQVSHHPPIRRVDNIFTTTHLLPAYSWFSAVVGRPHILELTTHLSAPQILFQIYFACWLFLATASEFLIFLWYMILLWDVVVPHIAFGQLRPFKIFFFLIQIRGRLVKNIEHYSKMVIFIPTENHFFTT